MSASKIKNLILLILLMANLFLLALVVPTALSRRAARQQADQTLIRLYQQAGITLSQENIPAAKPLLRSQLHPAAEHLSAAKALLGDNLLAQETSGGTSYASAQGTVFAALDGTLTAELHGDEAADPVSHALKLLDNMDISHAPILWLEDDGCAVAPLLADGVPLRGQEFRFYYNETGLYRVTGLLLQQPAIPTGTDPCISARDALTAFLGSRLDTGWMGSGINTVTQEYSMVWEETQGVWIASPVWRIDTDSGQYLVDGAEKNIKLWEE